MRIISNAIRRGEFTGRVWMFYDESDRAAALAGSEQSAALLRTTMDSLLDPVVLVEPVRDDTGRTVDFRYRDVNLYLRLPRSDSEDLIGKRMLEVSPNLQRSALLDLYRRCADRRTGRRRRRPYDNGSSAPRCGTTPGPIRPPAATSSSPGGTSPTVMSRAPDSLSPRSGSDCSPRTSPTWSVTFGTGVSWIRRRRRRFSAPRRSTGSAGRSGNRPSRRVGRVRPKAGILSRGETVFTRARIVSRDGTPHWIRLHAKPSYDSSGNHDGVVASFQVIDAVVVNEDFLRQARNTRSDPTPTSAD